MTRTAPLPEAVEHTLESAMATLDGSQRQTLEKNPMSTLEPATLDQSERAARALEILGKLDPRLSTASAGRLQLEATLAEGGMGLVRLATQLSVGRKVAVKSVRPDVTGRAAITKLLQEAWITGALEHPNIVPVYDVAVDDQGYPLIVLKRIEGRNWAELLGDPEAVESRFGVHDALDWHLRTLMQVTNAVHFAHSRGVIHRDIKPENVMIGEFGEVYVVDWGIAVSLTDDGGGRLPLAREMAGMAGTPCYMAPEMLSADGAALSVRSDVYLLGATLYEIVAGKPPHLGADLTELFRSVLLSNPTFPGSVPVELRAICARAMARDPAERYASAEELRLALQSYLEHASSAALAREAERALEQLVTETSTAEPDEAARARLYDRLGECRFGFRAALAAWRDNEAARQSLDRGLEAVALYELRRGDARSAGLLLSEMVSAPPSLERKIRRERERHEAEERRLKGLARDFDPNVGRKTRLVAGAFLGVIWTAAPVFTHVVTDNLASYSHREAIALGSVVLILGLLVVAWGRRSLLRNELNRRLVFGILAVMVIELVTDVWGIVTGHSPIEVIQLDLFLYFVVACSLAVLRTWGVWPAALGYGVAWFVGSLYPEWVLIAMAAANFVLTASAVWAWRKPIPLGTEGPNSLATTGRFSLLDLRGPEPPR